MQLHEQNEMKKAIRADVKRERLLEFKIKLVLVICIAGLLVIVGGKCALAQEYTELVRLEWDANTEEDLKGYRLYYHAEGDDYAPLDDILAPATTWQGFFTEGRHWWRLTAYDESGNESAPSNVVSYLVSAPTDETPPAIPGLRRVTTTTTTTTVTETGP